MFKQPLFGKKRKKTKRKASPDFPGGSLNLGSLGLGGGFPAPKPQSPPPQFRRRVQPRGGVYVPVGPGQRRPSLGRRHVRRPVPQPPRQPEPEESSTFIEWGDTAPRIGDDQSPFQTGATRGRWLGETGEEGTLESGAPMEDW